MKTKTLIAIIKENLPLIASCCALIFIIALRILIIASLCVIPVLFAVWLFKSVF